MKTDFFVSLFKLAPMGNRGTVQDDMFTDDLDPLNLTHLLLVNSNKTLLIQAFPV